MAYDNPEKQKQWRNINRDRENENARRWRENNPDKVALAKRKINLKQFGMTIKAYDKLFAKQRGACAICKQPDLDKRLAVDHCHQTGKVRGLLCDRCNFSLGGFEDNINLLNKAIEYLKIH